ncbi:PREDICTED: uncharacterized protein LOC104806489 [Tarenaya hassleriana]|uniref:uncharacterized protein LOC104806489 n=1 Tax=Tarenaya hassleriana TaxID=28532 RepID=UPI00053C4FD8|nr:PREDICTED: uncharacterized protein LOC104806489 [Tarenaya hassleriana]
MIYIHVLHYCTFIHRHLILSLQNSLSLSNSNLVVIPVPPTQMKSKFAKACENKLKMMKGKVVVPCTSCGNCCKRVRWPFKKEDGMVPKDVPKGHLVVYVGENHKRFVIKITLLKHPLFMALLDQARDVYNFTANSKLWIPCNETTFLDVVRCICACQHQRICMTCLQGKVLQ